MTAPSEPTGPAIPPLPRLWALRSPKPTLTHVPTLWNGRAFDASAPGRIVPDCALFHDAGVAGSLALTCRADGLTLGTTGDFDGTYASLALDLPKVMRADLDASHDVRVTLELRAAAQRPLPDAMHLRLSVEDAGDPWQMTVPLPVHIGVHSIPLGPGAGLPTRLPRVDRRVWIDLILSGLTDRAAHIPALSITRAPAPVL